MARTRGQRPHSVGSGTAVTGSARQRQLYELRLPSVRSSAMESNAPFASFSRAGFLANSPDVAQSAWFRGWRILDQLRDDKMILPWITPSP